MKKHASILTMAVMAVGLSAGLAQGDAEGQKPKRPEGAGPQGGGRGPGGGGDFLKRLDTDGDGSITKAEAGDRWERIARLDANNDGTIGKDELSAMPQGGPGRPRGPEGSPGTPGGPGGGGGGGGQMFERADKNGDGKLTQDEVPAEAWERIGRADKDGDKAVTREEMVALFREGGGGRPGGQGGMDGGRLFEMADRNKDGKITQDEAGERWERMAQLDKNGDGAISKDEFPQMGAGGPGRGGPDGRPGAGGGGGAGAIFGQSDKNGDGKLSQDEVSAEMWERLSKADKNADGLVSQEELSSAYGDRPGAGKGGDRPKPEGTEPPKGPKGA
ncbi:MAG: hypothetical protein KDL87_09975 [Verrucomicrobiae bacterium]|nr:hypothetical protein [Verrucomicrobiae bacterium]